MPEMDHDHDGCFPPHGPNDICPANPYADLPVYTTIHRYATALLLRMLLSTAFAGSAEMSYRRLVRLFLD